MLKSVKSGIFGVVGGVALAAILAASLQTGAPRAAQNAALDQHHFLRVAQSCTDYQRQSCVSQRQTCMMVVMADPSQQAEHNQECESDFDACLVGAGCRN